MGLIFKKSTAQPAFTVAAAITGTVQVGQTLTCSYTVTRARASNVTVRWYSYFDELGTDQVLVGTGTTYVLTGNEFGRYIRAIVTASNPAGTVQSTSSYTAAVVTEVPPDPPSILAAAAITGAPNVGETLTVTYDFDGETSVAIQWYSYASASQSDPQTLGTSSTQALTESESAEYIGCVVTATNAAGDTVSTAALVGPVSGSVSGAPAGAPADAIALDATAIASRLLPDGAVLLNGNGKYYYLVDNLSFSGNAFVINNQYITLHLNGKTVTYNTSGANTGWSTQDASVSSPKFGVFLYRAGVDTAYAGLLASNQTNNFTLRGGTLTTSTGGKNAHAIYSRNTTAAMVRDMTIQSGTGSDSFCIAGSSYRGTVQDSVLTALTAATANRHQGPGLMKCADTWATNTVQRCLLIGGNSSLNIGNNSVIANNVISHNGFVTNGYGVFAVDRTGIVASDNIIIPSNGRGIIASNSNGNTFEDNVILHWEHRNTEFGDALNPPAFRSRYNSYNNSFTNNFCLGVGGTKAGQTASEEHTGASTMYFTNYGTNTPGDTVAGNTGYVVFYGEPDDLEDAVCNVSLEGQGSLYGYADAGRDVITDNTFYSNQYMIKTNGYDTHSQQIVPMERNSWAWATGEEAYAAFAAQVVSKLATLPLVSAVATAASTQIDTVLASLAALIDDATHGALQTGRRFLYCLRQAHSGEIEYVDTIDDTFGSDVDPLTYKFGNPIGAIAGGLAYRTGFKHTLQLLDNGTPIASSAVTVTPNQIATLRDDETTGTTDGSGNVELTFWSSAITKGLLTTDGMATQVGVTSTITVDGVGSAVFDHATLPATLDLTA